MASHSLSIHKGGEFLKSACLTLFHFARGFVAHQSHVWWYWKHIWIISCFLEKMKLLYKSVKFKRSFENDWWRNIYPLHLSKEKLEDLIKEDKNFLNELTRNIQRQVKERMELRHVLSIESKHYYFNDLEQGLIEIWMGHSNWFC